MNPKTIAWLAQNNPPPVMKCEGCQWFLTDPAHCKQIAAKGWYALCMQVLKAKRKP